MNKVDATPLDLQFYNLATLQTRREKGQSDPAKQVRREVAGLLSMKPAVLGLAEAVGHNLPAMEGYRLIRDRSVPGRANIAAYVRRTPAYDITRHRWIDLKETWPRRQHPGAHDPRSFLSLWLGGVKVIVAHQAPRGSDTWDAQLEGVNVLEDLMDTRVATRPVVTLADWNRRRGESGPGPSTVAARVGGKVIGRKIDAAVVTDVKKVSGVRYVHRAGGVALLSDHPHALTLTVHVASGWLTGWNRGL